MISVLLVTPDGREERFSDGHGHGAQGDPATGVHSLSPSETATSVRLLVRELTMLEVERALILYYLDRCGGSQRRAAVAMGVPRSTLNDRVRRLGLVATGVEVKP